MKHASDPIGQHLSRAPKQPEREAPEMTVAERVELFLDGLKPLRSRRAVAAHVAAEVKTIRETYSLVRLANYMCRYRKAVADRYGAGHPAIGMMLSQPTAARLGLKPAECFGQTADEVRAAKRRARSRVVRFQRAQLPIPNPKKLISLAVQLITHPGVFERGARAGDPRWDRMLVGMALLTGRRPVEIGLFGELKKVRGQKHWAMFSGQAKTRGAETAQTSPYRIPLLAPATVILAGWENLREALPEFTDGTDFSNKTASRTADVMQEEFADLKVPLKLYDLRAIYARLTYHLFAPANMADVAWFAQVLGHTTLAEESPGKSAEIADTLTAAFYQRFYLPGGKRVLKL